MKRIRVEITEKQLEIIDVIVDELNKFKEGATRSTVVRLAIRALVEAIHKGDKEDGAA